VLSFRPIREEEAASLVRGIAASPALMNVSERIKVLMTDLLMRCAIGDRCPMRDEYIADMDKALELMAGFNLNDLFPGSWLARTLGAGSLRAARELHDRIHRITQAIIDYHESKGAAATTGDGEGSSRREDILDLLLRFQKDGGLGITLTTQVLSGVMFVSSQILTRSPGYTCDTKVACSPLFDGHGHISISSGCFRCRLRDHGNDDHLGYVRARQEPARDGASTVRSPATSSWQNKGARGRHPRPAPLPADGDQGDAEVAPSGAIDSPKVVW
jgi:hypothetical protein